MNANRALVTFVFLCSISPTLPADVVLAFAWGAKPA